MRRAYFFLFLFLFAQCKTSADKQAQDADNVPVPKPRRAYDYCYANKSGVFVFNAGDRIGQQIKLKATNIQLSPDGTWLAYTDYSQPDHERRIGLMDLTSQKTTLLDTACINCYGPVWSPDGRYLAYNAMKGTQWLIKYVDRVNTHADFVMSGDSAQLGYFSPSWTPDSKGIIVQDMSSVYIFDLKGNVLRQIPITDIDTTMGVGSSERFLLNAKGDKLVFDGESSADTASGSEDGPPSHLYVYDLPSKKLTRMDPAGYECGQPVLKGDTVFCSGFRRTGRAERFSNIYSVDIDGGHFRVAFKNCQGFSCRTKP